jgi:hypothetical protein
MGPSEEVGMPGAVSKRFENPDETREIPNGIISDVQLETSKAAKFAYQPGWRWSQSVKPIAGGDSCQMHHIGYALAGMLHVTAQDGTELDISTGDAYEIQPGHDAWVQGDQPFEGLEFDARTIEEYAKPS